MESSPEIIFEALSEAAEALGFDFVGAARAAESRYASAYREWVEKEYNGDMEWMARTPERRADPRLVFPGAKSVIVLGMSYFSPLEKSGVGSGEIARYAVGEDYHPVLESKLRDLDELLQVYGGSQRYYTDTGPVLERGWAEEAGLGWPGKSGLFIHPKIGSATFLAVILTTLELPYGREATNRCGFCRRCLDSCPTGAITEPGVVDARRCLSYLTIENKGEIPLEFRKSLGGRIYGCDSCLMACPWNRKAEWTREEAFLPIKRNLNLPVREYLSWTEEDFLRRFRRSPIRRIKWRGFMRNVCVAAGNTGTMADITLLETLAACGDSLVEEHARWASNEIREREGN